MAHSKQAKKRIRQTELHTLRNKDTGSAMRTWFKKVMAAVAAGDKAKAESILPMAMKRIDKAAKRNVIHDNAAARYKSRLARKIAAK